MRIDLSADMGGIAGAVHEDQTNPADPRLDVRLNGPSVGELGLNAALAGSFGVPVALMLPPFALALLLAPLPARSRPVASPAGLQADTARRQADSLPLAPSRTIEFETDEGTWISLDVSPDGTRLVFELMGDLYLLPLAGGEARPLTSGPAFDSQPRWSPDGRRIVFLSDRDGSENVWTMDADGTRLKQVSQGDKELYASPEWTPDGEYIVVSRTQGPIGSSYMLWLFHKDGGAGVSLTKDDKGERALGSGRGTTINSLGPAFGPDGRYIWYARKRGGFGYNIDLSQWQLAIFDRQTGRIYVQTDLYGSAMRPVLSPDGAWLVYASRHDAETGLRLRNLRTGDERWLRYPVQRDDQESRFTRDLYPGSSFTPDSRALVTTWGGRIWRVDLATGAAAEIPFRARVRLALGPAVSFPARVDTGEVQVKQVRDAALSPDGTRLVFSALDKLYVMQYPNGRPRRLTTDTLHEQNPAWSPDGRSVAYVTWGLEGGAILKVDAGGGRPARLTTEPGFYQWPCWSPDGRRLVALRGPREARLTERFGPGYELVWIPAGGGKATRVTPVNPGGRPHVSRDPDRIYLYDPADGLVSLRYDGTDRRAHVKITGFTVNVPDAQPNSADEILIAPDSGRVLALVNNYVYLVTLPQTGQQPLVLNVADPTATAFPARRLTRIGGDFIGWAGDGRSVFWSLGRSFFRYDLAAADSLAARKAAADSARADSLRELGDRADSAARARVDSLRKAPAYEPRRLDVTVTVPRDVPRGTLVLRGARIITMKGDEVIEDGDLVVSDNRIAYAGPRTATPPGARVLDVAGRTIIPGLVDIHAHPWPQWGIHQPQVWKYLANLAWGVTTVRDPQTATTDVLTYADQVEAGALLGPRIYHTGPGVFGPFLEEPFKDLDEVRNALKRYSEFYRVGTIKQYMAGNRKQRQWVIMAAREQGLMPTTEGGLDFKMNLTVAMDGYPGLEHSLPIMPLYRDAVELFARSGITYTPTLLVSYGGPWSENWYYERYDIHDLPKVRRFIPHQEIDRRVERRPWFRENQYVFRRIAEGARRIVEAGGRVGLGGHGQLDGLGDHWELWSLAAGGLKPHDVLRAGTLFGAEAIGLGQDLGSLEPGKLADLVVLDGNPLEDIHQTERIRYVMKNGRLYDGDTLDEVWPRAKPLERLWWWATEPAP
ncbi:MAG TPA: amidohydrolase family protein [Gemmatimonadales bacterium]|nr:amidohydrolase family protein [Gemmatimonadales bacterium]